MSGPPASARASTRPNDYPPWKARFWHGMVFGAYVRMLLRYRVHISPSRLPLAISIFWTSLLHSLGARLQTVVYGRRLAETAVHPQPVFVLGHWRSGTTLLHELLALDPQFGYADTVQCFTPADFLVARPIVERLRAFMPGRRPMDDMPVRPASPQEDEWALANLGVPSPYLMIGFPNEPDPGPAWFTLRDLSREERERWKATLYGFMQTVSVRSPRPLVLKSPTHTAHVRTLLELFPDARFVHIVRNPHDVFRSTLRTRRILYTVEGLQEPTFAGLEELVLLAFERTYAAFEEDRQGIRAGHIVDVRYEDLVRDPLGEMRRVYEGLALTGFEMARPAMQAYLGERRDYRPSAYAPDSELDAEIDRRWGPFMARYGYGRASEPSADAAPASVPERP